MTTTEVALIDLPDQPEPQALSKAEAKKLDRQIRSTSDKTIKNHERTLALFDELKALLTQARDGEIHKALGLKSWTAYLADAVNVQVPDREDRKALAQFLSGEGASQRTIGKMLGVSQKTVDRDLNGMEVDEGATVTSLDGAQRPRNGQATVADEEGEEDYIDGEIVGEEEDAPAEPMAAADIVRAFNDEMANLVASQGELFMLTQEDRWDKARKRVANADLNNLTHVINQLQSIVDDLMTSG